MCSAKSRLSQMSFSVLSDLRLTAPPMPRLSVNYIGTVSPCYAGNLTCESLVPFVDCVVFDDSSLIDTWSFLT